SAPTASRYRLDLAGAVHLKTEYADGRWDASCLYATPADDASTWVFGQSIRTRATHLVGDAFQRRFFRALMAEGEEAVATLLAKPTEGHPTEVSVAADGVGLAFRKIYARAVAR